MSPNTWIYLGSYSLSLLGNGIASVLFPLLVLTRTGDILAAGIVATATTAVAAVIGVVSGVVVDRLNRRTISIISDVISAVCVAALPVVDSVWGLNLAWFIALGVLGTFGDIPGMTARETMLPRLTSIDGARPGALDRLIGIRESLSAALMLIGPGIAGLLVYLIGVSSTALFITAGTSFTAAMLSLAISPKAGEISYQSSSNASGRLRVIRGVFKDLTSGWRFVLGHRLVLGTTVLSATFVAVLTGLQTTVLPAYFTREGIPGLSGFAMTGIALGSLFGAAIYAALTGKIKRRVWFVIGMIGSIVGFIIVGSMVTPWLVIAAAILIGLTNSPMSAILGLATIEATPDQMRGRVLGAQNALVLAAPALTAAPVAAVASHFGLAAAGFGIAIVMAAIGIAALCSSTFRSFDTMKER